MITNEVAFVAIAVSDKERARKFYQETLELKPTRTQMDGAWVEYDLGPTTIGVGCHPAWQPSRDGTTVAFEVEDFDDAVHEAQRTRRDVRHGKNRDAGLLDGAISRPRRKQARDSQEKMTKRE